MPEKFLKPNDIDAYKISFHLSNYVWNVVLKWDNFPRRTVGEQFVTAVDFGELQKLPEAINRLIKYTNVKLSK